MKNGSPRARLEAWLAADTASVARALIGARLIRRLPGWEPDAGVALAGRIVETEAYLPLVDPACHGYRGPTKRNESIFSRPGFAYVYFIYGNHYCLNVTTEAPGIGGAVLIRAIEPSAGIECMRRRRGRHVPTAALGSGPGNLCRAMGIDLRCNGADFRCGDLVIRPSSGEPPATSMGPRIGLKVAARWPLRYFDAASSSVSPFRKSLTRRPPNADG
ncbi:MAG: DNA-3-methyladenine glycosylase [Candidatus Eremiobacteraeota bacterium]|nr:DNA-3-methyladenine glycosylase [Candidatus Eremiobacteraeota bacterium]MBC5826503.1 DNA-3-methyladenine glycosylase [Candidatus Eremiobacteraeota bacterium]